MKELRTKLAEPYPTCSPVPQFQVMGMLTFHTSYTCPTLCPTPWLPAGSTVAALQPELTRGCLPPPDDECRLYCGQLGQGHSDSGQGGTPHHLQAGQWEWNPEAELEVFAHIFMPKKRAHSLSIMG